MNHSRRHLLIGMVTAIHIVFVLAAAAVVDTFVGVVVIPSFHVIALPPTVLGLTIEKSMSTGGVRQGFLSALCLILARHQHLMIKKVLAKGSEHPHVDVIVGI